MSVEKWDHRKASAAIAEADYYEFPEETNVGSWSPSPPGTPGVIATQVHLRFGKPPGRCMLVRFKSARALDELVDALLEHREFVWGKR